MKTAKGLTRVTSECCVESTEPELTPSFLLTRSVRFSGIAPSTPFSRFRSFSIDPLYEFPIVNASQSTEVDDKKTANSTVSASELTKVVRSSLKPVLVQLQKCSPFASDISSDDPSQDCGRSPIKEDAKRPAFATIFDSRCGLFTQDETIQSNEEALYTASSLFRTFEEQKFGEMIAECESEESVGFFRSTEALKRAMRTETIEEEGEDMSLSFAEEPPHCSAASFLPPGATASKNRLLHGPSKQYALTPIPPKILDTTALTSLMSVADADTSVEAPEGASPICRKLVICSSEDARVEVSSVWPCSGFRTALALQFSDVDTLNKATIRSDQSEGFLQLLTTPIMSVFTPAKVQWFSSGFEHCCIVLADGSVYTWGNGGSGCLGHGDTLSQVWPRQLVAPRMQRVCYLECGAYHNAAVTVDGELWTWGRGDVHQLGVASSRLTKDSVGTVALIPVRVESLSAIKAVACGEAHTLALDHNGCVYAFGWAEEGQLGLPEYLLEDGQSTHVACIPVLSRSKIAKVSAGAVFSACISDAGELFLWGNGQEGQLGFGAEIRSLPEPRPNATFNGDPVLDVICSEASVICLTASGKVYGWGKGVAGKFCSGRFAPGTVLVRCSPILLEEAEIAHKIVVPQWQEP